MAYTLGLNTNCLLNRFAEPEELVGTVAEQVGLDRIQLTADVLNPDLPAPVLRDQVARYVRAGERYGARITSTFTGNYTRLNHLCHPEAAVREHWVAWFKRLVDLTVDLGARTTGSHLGIFTYRDDRDPARRAERFDQMLDGWRRIGAHAKARGLPFLSWEPMSVHREQGETIAECRRLQDLVNVDMPVPIRINLDIDHGDVASPDPRDTDPYAWLAAFAAESPIVHIKQSSMNKGGHWPFTAERNAEGRIVPQKVLTTLAAFGADDTELVFELSFREREPTDSMVVAAMRESAAYWRPYVPA